MQLKIKFLKWSAGIPVAMLHKETAKKLGIHTKARIYLRTLIKHPKEFHTIVNIIGDHIVKKNEIAVSSEIKERMNLSNNQKIEIGLAETPISLDLIKKKLNNQELSENEIKEIVIDIVGNELSESEIALFISSMYIHGMNLRETIYLTKAILKSGNIFKLNKKFIADKHCIGGVPNNKAITSAAGTADTMEVLAQVGFSVDKLKKILKKTNAFLVWGGAMGMVPADEEIIRIEKELKIDPEAQLLASIMSKKLAVGSHYILIDIPYGENAKVSLSKAVKLKKKFEKIGKYFKKKLEVVLTKGDQPIGNGIGPVLEMIDVLKILDPKQQGPKDLETKSVFLAGKILEMTGKAKKSQGIKKAEEILSSGMAYKKFKQIIQAQDGAIKKLIPGKFKHNILSDKNGKILEINNKLINLLARIAGCPTDKSAGIYLYAHKYDKIKKNEKLLTIYSESESRLNEAVKFYAKNSIIIIK